MPRPHEPRPVEGVDERAVDDRAHRRQRRRDQRDRRRRSRSATTSIACTGRSGSRSATTSQMALTLARPEGNPPGGSGLALFYLETRDDAGAMNGIAVNRLKDKLGTRMVPTAELTLDGARAIAVTGTGERHQEHHADADHHPHLERGDRGVRHAARHGARARLREAARRVRRAARREAAALGHARGMQAEYRGGVPPVVPRRRAPREGRERARSTSTRRRSSG